MNPAFYIGYQSLQIFNMEKGEKTVRKGIDICFWIVLLVIGLWALPVEAEKAEGQLSIQDCVSMALEVNLAIRNAEEDVRAAIDRHRPNTPTIQRIDRFAFYDRAQTAFAVVMTGETAKYGNIILKKGVTPC